MTPDPSATRMETQTKPELILSWICRAVAAAILLQTLFFKFTGAAESVYIFTRVGIEPWGRYGTGLAELVATVLLLMPRFAWAGGLLALALMGGALGSHAAVLGIVVQNDHGLLFGLAVTVFVCGLVTAILHRRDIPHQCHRCQNLPQ